MSSYQDLAEFTAVNNFSIFLIQFRQQLIESELELVQKYYDYVKPLIHNPRLQKILDNIWDRWKDAQGLNDKDVEVSGK